VCDGRSVVGSPSCWMSEWEGVHGAWRRPTLPRGRHILSPFFLLLSVLSTSVDTIHIPGWILYIRVSALLRVSALFQGLGSSRAALGRSQALSYHACIFTEQGRSPAESTCDKGKDADDSFITIEPVSSQRVLPYENPVRPTRIWKDIPSHRGCTCSGRIPSRSSKTRQATRGQF
jgi:hypothetical protein